MKSPRTKVLATCLGALLMLPMYPGLAWAGAALAEKAERLTLAGVAGAQPFFLCRDKKPLKLKVEGPGELELVVVSLIPADRPQGRGAALKIAGAGPEARVALSTVRSGQTFAETNKFVPSREIRTRIKIPAGLHSIVIAFDGIEPPDAGVSIAFQERTAGVATASGEKRSGEVSEPPKANRAASDPASAQAKPNKIGIVLDARAGYLFSTGDMTSAYPEIGVSYLLPFHRQRVSVSLSFSFYQHSQESEQTEQYLGTIESEYSIEVMPLLLEGTYRYRHGKWAVQGSFGPMLAMIGGHVSAANQNGPILPREEFNQVSLGLAASLGGGYQIGPGDLELTWRWLTAGLDREESETSADVGGMAMMLGYRYKF